MCFDAMRHGEIEFLKKVNHRPKVHNFWNKFFSYVFEKYSVPSLLSRSIIGKNKLVDIENNFNGNGKETIVNRVRLRLEVIF